MITFGNRAHPVPVAPCVDSGIAYDNFAETIERIHDVFPVCFCAIHRNFPLSPTWGGAWFTVAFVIQRGNNIEAVAPLIIDYKKEPITAILYFCVLSALRLCIWLFDNRNIKLCYTD